MMDDLVDGGVMSTAKNINKSSLFGQRYKIYIPDYEDEINPAGEITSVDTDSFYRMKTFPRGKLVILNMKNFTSKSGLQNYERVGTEIDAEALKTLFVEKFGFICEVYDDLNKTEVLKVLKYTSNEQYTDFSALCIAFLTHGKEKVIYATDACIEIRKITRMFTGSNLAGKPKIFLIQACQGSDHMDEIDSGGWVRNTDKLSLPIEADFLYAYSTAAGFYSWRNNAKGSWFIQTLCEVFNEHAHNTDIVRMLTKVNAIISQRTSRTKLPQTDNKRQVSSTVSQLRKEFYFFPPTISVEEDTK